MADKDSMVQRIMDELEGQPDFVFKTVEWLVSHLKLAQILYDHNTPISEKEFEEEKQKAFRTQDHAYYALLMYQKVMQEQQRNKICE